MILEILNKVYASRNLQRITEFFRSDLMSSPNPEDRFVARMITGYFKPEELRTFINPERFLNEVSVSNQDNVYRVNDDKTRKDYISRIKALSKWMRIRKNLNLTV